jgi:hypothetical protein
VTDQDDVTGQPIASQTDIAHHIIDDVFHVRDAVGDEGSYRASFTAVLNISEETVRKYRAPKVGMTLFVVEADYSAWPKYSDHRVSYLGYRVPAPPEIAADQSAITMQFNLPDGALFLFLIYASVRIDGLDAQGQIRRVDDGIFYSILNIDPRGNDQETIRIKRALRDITGIKPNPGGRRKGSVKGRAWSRREILEWYSEASDAYARDRSMPRLKDLGQAMEVSEDTASTRVRDANLSWPPTPEELDELDDE